MQGKFDFETFKLKLGKILALLLAILILNCSVDPPDSSSTLIFQGNQFRENLLKNDIENLYEFIAEVVLEIDNHVSEYDESDYEFEIKKIDVSTLNSSYPELKCIVQDRITFPLVLVNHVWRYEESQYIPPDFS